jgi:hypothetical protein
MNSLKNIIESYKGVKEEIYIKCTCKTCQSIKKPTTFLYDQLLEKLAEKGHTAIITCNVSDETLKIMELLYDTGFFVSPPEQYLCSFPEQDILVLRKMEQQQSVKRIPIFLASSEELKEDREKFEIFINRENKEYTKKGIFLELVLWEDFIDKMSQTRLQDEYNKAAIEADIFISLFWTKVGKYTKEEFDKAYTHFKKKNKPSVYTYFKNAPVNPKDLRRDNADSIFNFKDELEKLGHYPTYYENINDLENQFRKQLAKLIE